MNEIFPRAAVSFRGGSIVADALYTSVCEGDRPKPGREREMLSELEILQAVDSRSLTVSRRHDPEFSATWKAILRMAGLGYFDTMRPSPRTLDQEATVDEVRIDGLSETGKARLREFTRA